MNLVPFDDASGALAEYKAKGAEYSMNNDVVTAPAFPHLSIKGKKFTIVRDGLKHIMRKPDAQDEVAQSIELVVLRANSNAKVFYSAAYDTEGSEGSTFGAQDAGCCAAYLNAKF